MLFMISTYTILALICYLPLISTMAITIYRNARFESFDHDSIVDNISSIESQDICICQCFSNPLCKIVTYNGFYRYCILDSAHLQEGQLRIMTMESNSTVFILRNVTSFDLAVSTTATTVETSAQSLIPTNHQAGITSTHGLSIMITTTISTTATTTVSTCPTLVTFDDISPQSYVSSIIPNGYKNLNWIHAEYIDISTISAMSGYPQGVRSRPFVLHNPTSSNITIKPANSTHFSFNSLYLTSAWRDNLTVTMNIIQAGFIISNNLTTMTSYPTQILCSFCTNISSITLKTNGGIPHANYAQNGTELIVDNLCISFEH